MGQTPTIEAKQRDRIGSRYAKRLRAGGQLPAVIYGHMTDPIPVSINHKEMLSHLQHGRRVFDVKVNGASETCLVKELQFDHLSTTLIHVDMARIDLSEEVEVHANLKFIGTPVGLKTEGAVFSTPMTSIAINCRASDIPSEAIMVDVSKLEADDYITAGQITLPDGMTLAEDPEEIVARISIVAEEAAAPAGEEITEPEVITERKAEAEEGAEGENEKE